jgi:hypothetical protein
VIALDHGRRLVAALRRSHPQLCGDAVGPFAGRAGPTPHRRAYRTGARTAPTPPRLPLFVDGKQLIDNCGRSAGDRDPLHALANNPESVGPRSPGTTVMSSARN